MQAILNLSDENVNSFASVYKYKETIEDESGKIVQNPVSKEQFAKNILRSFAQEVHIEAQVKPIEELKKETTITATAESETISVE